MWLLNCFIQKASSSSIAFNFPSLCPITYFNLLMVILHFFLLNSTLTSFLSNWRECVQFDLQFWYTKNIFQYHAELPRVIKNRQMHISYYVGTQYTVICKIYLQQRLRGQIIHSALLIRCHVLCFTILHL